MTNQLIAAIATALAIAAVLGGGGIVVAWLIFGALERQKDEVNKK